MATFIDAYNAIRTRLEANAIAGVEYRWQNEQNTDLPDTATTFCYVELLSERTFIAGFGGGRYNNLWRTECRLELHVFVPIGEGLAVAAANAETLAALFRSYRTDTISCFAARVEPGGRDEVDGNYWTVRAVIQLHFDQTG